MRDRIASLFVINDEKNVTVPFPDVRVGPPESSKGDRKVTKSTFFRPIKSKRAQNRPVPGHFLSRFEPAFARSIGKTRAFGQELAKRCPGTRRNPVLEDRIPTTKQNREYSVKSCQEPSFPVKKSVSAALRAASVASG